jgi:hypothetical protein
MKKLASILLIIVVIAGCKKKTDIYKENLNGTWNVYKYLLNNTDKTQQFQNQNPNYSISFTEGSAFTELITNPDSSFTTGTYSFAASDEKLVLTNVYYTYTTDTAWVDTTNFIIDTISISHNSARTFTIFNLTRDHVELKTDSSVRYMKKIL